MRTLLHWTVTYHSWPTLIDSRVYTWKLGFFKSSFCLFPSSGYPCLWVVSLYECCVTCLKTCGDHPACFSKSLWVFWLGVILACLLYLDPSLLKAQCISWCMVGLLRSSVGAWIQGVCVILFVVLYLCGEPLYSIRIFSLLFHLSPLIGLFLAYVSDQPLLVAFVWFQKLVGIVFLLLLLVYFTLPKLLTCLLYKPSSQVKFMLTLVLSRVCWVVA